MEMAWRSSTPHPDLPSGAVSVAATDVEDGAQGTDEAVTSVHETSAKSAVWAEAALPPSSSEATLTMTGVSGARGQPRRPRG